MPFAVDFPSHRVSWRHRDGYYHTRSRHDPRDCHCAASRALRSIQRKAPIREVSLGALTLGFVVNWFRLPVWPRQLEHPTSSCGVVAFQPLELRTTWLKQCLAQRFVCISEEVGQRLEVDNNSGSVRAKPKRPDAVGNAGQDQHAIAARAGR